MSPLKMLTATGSDNSWRAKSVPKLEPAQSGQMDIDDDAIHCRRPGFEGLSRGKQLDAMAHRPEQPRQCHANIVIVIYDCQRQGIVRRHFNRPILRHLKLCGLISWTHVW